MHINRSNYIQVNFNSLFLKKIIKSYDDFKVYKYKTETIVNILHNNNFYFLLIQYTWLLLSYIEVQHRTIKY